MLGAGRSPRVDNRAKWSYRKRPFAGKRGARINMSIRVIAGTAKGFSLEVPKGRCVRPTLDRVREALFSSLMPRLKGARFLDLFAGTGANGIEALSRGAQSCTFVDRDPGILQVVERNLDGTGLLERATVLRAVLPKGLDKLRETRSAYDIIFADPSHNFSDYNSLLRKVRNCELLREGGIIILEHDERFRIGQGLAGYRLEREARYGRTHLSFLA